MQSYDFNLNEMTCLNPNHYQREIQFLCVYPNCNQQSRFVCVDCYYSHKDHRLFNNKLLSEDIHKNLSTESPLAQETLLLFQQLKEKIISSLDLIEIELNRVCSIKIPNLVAEELLKFLRTQQFNRDELNQKISNYLKTTTDEQLQKQKAQKNLSTDQLCKFSNYISNYLTKLNHWLAQMPNISFKPNTQRVLQKYSEDFGTPYYNKIKPEKYLIQQFSVKCPTRLNQIKHGKIEGQNGQLIQFNFYIGTLLESPFYKYSVRIQQMIMDKRSQNEFITEFITKLDPPIYLYPKMKYCISINSQEQLQILDFSQKSQQNYQNQNFSLHTLTDYNEQMFTQRYFVTEFIYDIMEIL
ncbi:hypothetical protein pb186bvf_014587 [Paramecium bursaria]